MTEICLFSGTTEGRKLAGFLSVQNIQLTVCVATEYGGQVLPPTENIRLIEKRLSLEDMIQMFSSGHYDMVIDATHPYAAQATENIRTACAQTETPYCRLLRGKSDILEETVTVQDIPSAVKYLEKTTGNILLTTGSKEITEYTALPDFRDRIYARVLPMHSSLDACTEIGLKPSHIIAMQGPFSEEMNRAMLRSVKAEWLVTKDSGDAGGFEAKVSAAIKEDVRLLVIGRPPQIEGMDESEIIAFLCRKFGFKINPSVKIIGIGPGTRSGMTMEAIRGIENADCLIGSRRMLETASGFGIRSFEAISEQTIADFIHSHHEYTSFAVLMSGDSSFFSGSKRLLPLLDDCEVEVLPGVSSLACLCARLRKSYEDVYTVSLHGRSRNIIPDVRSHDQLFVLTGGENTVNSICSQLIENGLGHIYMHVGERLGYPDEKIISGTVNDLARLDFSKLSVVLVENDSPDMIVTHGLPDDAFLRNTGEKGLIPMTKSEIRSVCLSKLKLTERSVCWDIGAGTGSVAIEMALQAKKGHVFAIERDKAAVQLIETNAKRLGVENLTTVTGTAPQALADLPTPTHIFIGGSSGNLHEIFNVIAALKSPIRIAAAAVSLNAVSELTDIIEAYPVMDEEVVMIQTAHNKKAGDYHLMLGGNPVYIFSMALSENRQ